MHSMKFFLIILLKSLNYICNILWFCDVNDLGHLIVNNAIKHCNSSCICDSGITNFHQPES